MRMSGQVTPVPSRIRSVVAAIPPITLHTKGAWPCSSTHGWKWSETTRCSKPAPSAAFACVTRSLGACSSDESQ
jgi:hypothetical protein